MNAAKSEMFQASRVPSAHGFLAAVKNPQPDGVRLAKLPFALVPRPPRGTVNNGESHAIHRFHSLSSRFLSMFKRFHSMFK